MKKPVIFLGFGILAVIILFFFLYSGDEESSPSSTGEYHAAPEAPIEYEDDYGYYEDDYNDDEDEYEYGEDYEDEEDDDLVVPELTSEDINAAIFGGNSEEGDMGDEGERTKKSIEEKFLTEGQKKELHSASLVRGREIEEKYQKYKVSWKETASFTGLPKLPETVPVYFFDRPEESDIFSFLKDLSKHLELKGAIIRMNPQTYSIADIAKGNYFLNYDLYHLGFTASKLDIFLEEEGENNVKNTLKRWGLLQFPNVEKISTDSRGEKWYRYIPDLPLSVLTLQKKSFSSGFTPGTFGEVHVQSDGDYITGIISQFPNIVEQGTFSLFGKEEINQILREGVFFLGDIELQYPGAVPGEERRIFHSISERERISIAEAELSRVECGYFLKDKRFFQALLSPICMAHGKGKVKHYSVQFSVGFPVIAE
jgi:hypothetical protein